MASSACGPAAEPPPEKPVPATQAAGDSAPAQAAPATRPRGTGGIGAPNIPWAEKTRAQRQDYMGVYVLPAMEKLFAEWRPDEYGSGKFRCQTCHGEGFDKPPVDFKMPRVSFPLNPADPIGAAMKYDPEVTRFMVEKVVPTMAELLGEKPYDEKTKQGFGCLRCHPPSRAKR